jgi:hypothetical protein
MTNLLSLPGEVLTEIMFYIFEEYPNLWKIWSAALVCRSLSRIVRPVLFRSIVIYICHESRVCDLFLRSINERPQLADMVWYMELSWGKRSSDPHTKANDILSKLHALRRLSISTRPDCDWDDEPFRPAFLANNSMKHLTSLVLKDIILDMDILAEYLFIDSLDALSIAWVIPADPPQPPQSLIGRTSPVKTLKFCPYVHMPTEVMDQVLLWFPKVQKLSCAIPGRDIPDIFTFPRSEISTPFSPAGTSQVLYSTRDSLEELELYHGFVRWPSLDGSRLDLSQMAKLKVLTCPAACVFVPNSTYEKRSGLFRLLPRALEKLSVCHMQYIIIAE